MPPPPPLYPPHPTCGGSGVNSRGEQKCSTRQTFTADRHGCPAFLLETWCHWLSKPSRHKTAVFAVNWCSVTRQILQWTLKQLPILLSGILYEQGQSQQDQDLQCGAKVKGTSGLAAHRLTNLIASRNQSALQVSQTPFCTYCTSLWRAGISIPYTESLSCGETLWRVGLSIPYAESLSCGETWWRARLRLSIPYTESRSSGGDLCMAQPTELIVQQLRKWPVAFELL